MFAGPCLPEEGGEAADEVDYGGDAHRQTQTVVPQTEMRNLHRRKQFDSPRQQRGEEEENQQPGVGVEPTEFILQGREHLAELRPVDYQEQCHGVTERPMDGFQHAARLDEDAVALEMQDDAQY